MSKTAKILMTGVSLALLLVFVVVLNGQRMKVSEYSEGLSPIPSQTPQVTREGNLPKVDQVKLSQDYQGQIKAKVKDIKTGAQNNQELDSKLRGELLAMVVPGDYRDLHLSLVRLVSIEEDNSTLLTQVNEVEAEYPWLSN